MDKSLYKGQIPFRTQGQTTCIHHKGRELDFFCKQCQELVCAKCMSTLHDSHPLCELSELTFQKKQDINNFIEKTVNIDLVLIDQCITSADEYLKKNISRFQKLYQQLKMQTKKLKDELDQLLAQTLSLYKQMEEDNAKVLQGYKHDLEMHSTQLKQEVQECNILLQCGSAIQIYDTKCEVHTPISLPINPTLATTSFTPNRNPQSLLVQALGELETSYEGPDRLFASPDEQRPSSHQQRPPSHQQSPSSHQQRPPSHQMSSESKAEATSLQQLSMKGKGQPLLSETKVVGEWKSPCLIDFLCPTTDGQVWTGKPFSGALTLLDRKGKIVQEVKHNTTINGISVSPTNNTLWACDNENNITQLVSGCLVHRFSTRQEPECICITASNHVIVKTDNQISKFTAKGTFVLKTTTNVETGQPITNMISECPVTHNIAVSNCLCAVVVMDTDFKELFVYKGEITQIYLPTLQAGGNPFHPQGVVYDSVGNLAIGDWKNNRVLLISGRGEFLGLICTDDRWTQTFGIDKEDVLWAVFRNGIVRQLQYSNMHGRDNEVNDKQCILS